LVAKTAAQKEMSSVDLRADNLASYSAVKLGETTVDSTAGC